MVFTARLKKSSRTFYRFFILFELVVSTRLTAAIIAPSRRLCRKTLIDDNDPNS